MARLQILELPEGNGDDRPPFGLVVDQADYDSLSSLSAALEGWQNLKEQIGARAVLVFEETVDIPANDTSAYIQQAAQETGATIGKITSAFNAQTLADERTDIARDMDRLAKRRDELADALGMDHTRDWDDIRNAATRLRKSNEARGEAIDRVLSLPFDPEVMDAQHAEPTGYRHGYRIAIQDAKRAVGYQSDHPTENQARA